MRDEELLVLGCSDLDRSLLGYPGPGTASWTIDAGVPERQMILVAEF